MAISVIFFVARVWDAINDPMMGSIVDHTRTKWGKCKPYLMFVPIPIGIITILTFCNKTYTDYTSTGAHVLIIAWAAISYILWGMCYINSPVASEPIRLTVAPCRCQICSICDSAITSLALNP